MEEHHLPVKRTARYHSLGEPGTARHLWIVLHGYGQLARFFLRPFTGLEGGRYIAAPEGLSRFYTDAAHTRVGSSWMTSEDRPQEIRDQAGYLNTLAAHLARQCPPATPLNVLGFSQGVATAARWALANELPIARLVCWGGTLPPEPDAAGLASHWANIAIDLVHGERDVLVPASALHRNEARLREAGLPYRILRFPGGHELDQLTLKRVLDQPH